MNWCNDLNDTLARTFSARARIKGVHVCSEHEIVRIFVGHGVLKNLYCILKLSV